LPAYPKHNILIKVSRKKCGYPVHEIAKSKKIRHDLRGVGNREKDGLRFVLAEALSNFKLRSRQAVRFVLGRVK
jgi:hypothetical protein